MKKIIIILLMLSSIVSYSQYGDAYHASNTYKLNQMRQERMSQNDASHRANISSKQGSSGVYAPNKSFPYMMSQKQKDDIAHRVKIAARIREIEEQDRINKENWNKNRIENDKREKAYLNQYVPILSSKGIDESDAIVNLIGSFSRINELEHVSEERALLRTKIFEFTGYVEKFNAEINTTSYEELLYYVYNFKEFPFTAVSSVQQLQKKFPDKKQELDQFLLREVMPIFFDGNQYKSSVYVDPLNEYSEGLVCNYCTDSKGFFDEKTATRNYFLSLENDYPEAFKIGIGKIRLKNSPYMVIAQQALKDNNEDVAESYFLKQLNCPTQAYYEQNEGFNNYVYHNREMLDFLKKKSKEFRKFEYQDFAYIAKIKGLSFIEVLEMFGIFKFREHGEFGEYKAPKECKDTYKCSACYKTRPNGFSYCEEISSKAKDLIYQAAQEDEPSALNAYGLIVAAGETKEPQINCFNYLKKAADSNYAWAAYNYLTAVGWNLKGYNDTIFNQGVDIWYNYKPVSEIEKLRYEEAGLALYRLELYHYRKTNKYYNGSRFVKVE